MGATWALREYKEFNTGMEQLDDIELQKSQKVQKSTRIAKDY
jgi:hypothetical protein